MNGNFNILAKDDYRGWLTKGKVYEFKGGHITYDGGFTASTYYPDFEDWARCNPTIAECAALLANNQSIVIYQKDREVIASLKSGKETVKTAKATCASDKFDFNVGAKLAFSRLMGKEIKEAVKSSIRIANQNKYEVGDKVELVVSHMGAHVGDRGIVIGVRTESETGITVEFDNNVGGHGGSICGRTGKDGHCYHCSPDELKVLDATVKQVHRPAKVGEWIKVVAPINGDSRYYSIGEICKVVKCNLEARGVYATTRKTHPCNCGVGTSYLYGTEYDVLENYTPEAKELKEKTLSDYSDTELTTEILRRLGGK